MRKILAPVVLLSLLLAGCSPAGGPSQSQAPTPSATPYTFVNLIFGPDGATDTALIGPVLYEERNPVTDPLCLLPPEEVANDFHRRLSIGNPSIDLNETVMVKVGTNGGKSSEKAGWWIVATTSNYQGKRYLSRELTDADDTGEFSGVWRSTVEEWTDERLIDLDKAISTALACLGLKPVPFP